MTRVRNLADLLDSSGDVKLAHLDNTTSVTVNNTLTSTSTTEALSANQGKTLKTLADGKEAADSTILKDADIGVNVQAYDSTIVVDADIGSTVQAYDADLATVASSGIGTSANQMVRLDGSAKLPAVDGSALTGMGGGSWTFLSTVTASSASTVTISSNINSTYDVYMMVADRVTISENDRNLTCELLIGGSWRTSGYEFVTMKNTSYGTSTSVQTLANHTDLHISEQLGNASGESFNLEIKIFNPSSTSYYQLIKWNFFELNENGDVQRVDGWGFNSSTGALTGIRFKLSSGTITGNFRLYGLNKS